MLKYLLSMCQKLTERTTILSQLKRPLLAGLWSGIKATCTWLVWSGLYSTTSTLQESSKMANKYTLSSKWSIRRIQGWMKIVLKVRRRSCVRLLAFKTLGCVTWWLRSSSTNVKAPNSSSRLTSSTTLTNFGELRSVKVKQRKSLTAINRKQILSELKWLEHIKVWI